MTSSASSFPIVDSFGGHSRESSDSGRAGNPRLASSSALRFQAPGLTTWIVALRLAPVRRDVAVSEDDQVSRYPCGAVGSCRFDGLRVENAAARVARRRGERRWRSVLCVGWWCPCRVVPMEKFFLRALGRSYTYCCADTAPPTAPGSISGGRRGSSTSGQGGVTGGGRRFAEATAAILRHKSSKDQRKSTRKRRK